MKVRYLTAAAAAGLISGAAAAQEPGRLPASPAVANQQLANAVADRLTASGAAATADVSIVVVAGEVTLTGTAKDAAAKDKIVDQVRNMTGVTKVRDGIAVATTVTQVKGQDLPTLPVGPLVAQPIIGNPPAMMMAGPGAGPTIDPVPLGGNGMGPDMGAPPLPPNAWPTYAPYNNVSRVAYPTAYPYNAFPFIGPFYPFPKVPLGWRSVELKWDDGHWWIGKTQQPYDYWRVRFW